MTIFEAKQFGNKEINSPTTSLDVNCILEYITGFSKTQLLLNSKNELSTEQESDFLEAINKRGIHKIAGVPDSTLKQFCDELQFQGDVFSHDVTANEGAAVGVAVGSFLGSGKPACVYMQNSGLGNIINPVASIANQEVYGIPMLFVIGWRGEPGIKDEPQHVFQGKIT